MQITSVSTDDCLDAFPLMLNNPIVLYTCHVFGGFQFIGFTKSGHIAVSVHDYCLGGYNRSIILVECSEMDKSQLWKYDKEVCVHFFLQVLLIPTQQTQMLSEKSYIFGSVAVLQ